MQCLSVSNPFEIKRVLVLKNKLLRKMSNYCAVMNGRLPRVRVPDEIFKFDMSRFHPCELPSTTTWVSYGSNVWLLHIITKKENTMNNVINDKYNKNDILLCFKNYTSLGGSSHCTLNSDLQKKKHSKAIYKVPQSSTLQHCHATLHSPLSHTHTHMQHSYSQLISSRDEGKSQSITRPNVSGLLEFFFFFF